MSSSKGNVWKLLERIEQLMEGNVWKWNIRKECARWRSDALIGKGNGFTLEIPFHRDVSYTPIFETAIVRRGIFFPVVRIYLYNQQMGATGILRNIFAQGMCVVEIEHDGKFREDREKNIRREEEAAGALLHHWFGHLPIAH